MANVLECFPDLDVLQTISPEKKSSF